ncbi:L-arabinose ABC transporter permease AraH [candidate division KSB3 bacterium]|uniref:L-arabinose ABC transporter permease AraH n=1 Tax=candidate division KSB3 bacterium TaxID=2044937 RepID=A0A2G6E5K3_9BACT|nr:MAG: L-arabinose ABC transporter permease AraH [candidate division KSB3 bacterium]PIE29625.1 MAG: L-arabinose ABC transporter permease AraH [candidate division KSB3 bacterium]
MSNTQVSKTVKNLWENSGMLLVYVIMFILFSLFVPYFFTMRNMIGLGLSVTTIGMVAGTMLFALGAGDLDLSVGSTVAFTGVVTAVVINASGSVILGILLGILAGGVVGTLNGVFIANFSLNPLITTLASMQIVRGLAFITSGGRAVGIAKAEFFGLGNGAVLGVPNPIWLTIIIVAIFGVLLNNTAYGKNTLAIGGNKEAARLAGVNVTLTKNTIFILIGLVSGFAGVVLASRMTSGQPNAALGFELDVISACVLGGVSLSGGVATIGGVVVGVMIMGTVQDVLSLLNVPTFYQYVVRGIILLIAVLLDQLKQRRKG